MGVGVEVGVEVCMGVEVGVEVCMGVEVGVEVCMGVEVGVGFEMCRSIPTHFKTYTHFNTHTHFYTHIYTQLSSVSVYCMICQSHLKHPPAVLLCDDVLSVMADGFHKHSQESLKHNGRLVGHWHWRVCTHAKCSHAI